MNKSHFYLDILLFHKLRHTCHLSLLCTHAYEPYLLCSFTEVTSSLLERFGYTHGHVLSPFDLELFKSFLVSEYDGLC